MKYKELIEFKKKMCNEYISLYEKKGFKRIQPLPLDNKNDISVDFTTCTICSAKDNITNNVFGMDYIMIQPALRNTHISNLGNINDKNYFFSYFTMIGGFCYYRGDNYINKFNDVVKTEFEFLSKYGTSVVLTIPNAYKEYLELNENCKEYLKKNKCIIKYSDVDDKNLKWKYGIGGVEGYGTRWEVYNGGDLVNYGNTINVIRNGIPFGVDFGGGVESLIYANKRLKSSIYANDALTDNCISFCAKSDINEKILDCIISSMCIIANKEEILFRDRIVLETYMRILNSLSIIENIPREMIIKIVKDIDEKNIDVLKKENMISSFEYYLSEAENNFSLLLESDNINQVLKLVDLCYDGNSNWLNNKRIVLSHCRKYFTKLTEVDLLALKSKKNYVLERSKTND